MEKKKMIQEVGTYVDDRQRKSTIRIIGVLSEETQREQNKY